MNLTKTYLHQAPRLNVPVGFRGMGNIAWRSPSNIALIKYWGKKPDQVPRNASLSFTLNQSYTETRVKYSLHKKSSPVVDFLFEGKANEPFKKRVAAYVLSMTQYLPFLNHFHLEVSSTNSFPHSSGIASSASSMSALALCLASMENDLFGTLKDPADLFRKAAFLARLGSGSATRSVYGGFVSWGNTDVLQGSNDEAGVPWPLESGNSFATLRDAILITSAGEKTVSSSRGHGMMDQHPWAEARYVQASRNLADLVMAIQAENDEDFIRIIENEALSLHALMLSSHLGYRLMSAKTWAIVDRVRKLRDTEELFVAFTLDAGPNVHLIYKENDRDRIRAFIREELIGFCENGQWIDDGIGSGPEEIEVS